MEAMCDERAGDTKVRVKILKHVGYLQENLLRVGCCWLVALLLKIQFFLFPYLSAAW